MKWFKHMTDLSQDEDIARYLDESGRDQATAYGFLVLVLETVASRMGAKGDPNCSATYSISQWQRLTYSHANRVMKYLRLCKVIGWVQVEFEGSSCKVTIPRMVEWRDEYSRKSGHTPDKVAQSRADKSKEEKRESKDDDSLSDGLAGKKASRYPPHDFTVTQELRAWATEKRPEIDIDFETEKFMLWEFDPPTSDWNKRWRKWILDAKVNPSGRQFGNTTSDRKQDLAKMAPLLGMQQGSDESESDFLDRIEEANNRRIDGLSSPGTLQ